MLKCTKEIYNKIKGYSQSHLPDESCGLLVSTHDDLTVDLFIPIKNISNQSDEFVLDPEDFLQALNIIENSAYQWIGVIHTHPKTSAIPSTKDIKNWHYPELNYFIYSCKEDRLRAYKILGEQVESVAFTYL